MIFMSLLGIQIRSGNDRLRTMFDGFGDADVDAGVRAERSMLSRLHGGCSVPVGAYGRVEGGVLRLDAQVTSLDGRQVVRACGKGDAAAPEQLGYEVADDLLAQGAAAILTDIRPGAVSV